MKILVFVTAALFVGGTVAFFIWKVLTAMVMDLSGFQNLFMVQVWVALFMISTVILIFGKELSDILDEVMDLLPKPNRHDSSRSS